MNFMVEYIFDLFPDAVKEYFYNNDNKIFLSLDQTFINFPFEFLANGKEFIGEKHLLPRVSGFNMFNKIINSNPKIKFQNKKLIVFRIHPTTCGFFFNFYLIFSKMISIY